MFKHPVPLPENNTFATIKLHAFALEMQHWWNNSQVSKGKKKKNPVFETRGKNNMLLCHLYKMWTLTAIIEKWPNHCEKYLTLTKVYKYYQVLNQILRYVNCTDCKGTTLTSTSWRYYLNDFKRNRIVLLSSPWTNNFSACVIVYQTGRIIILSISQIYWEEY